MATMSKQSKEMELRQNSQIPDYLLQPDGINKALEEIGQLIKQRENKASEEKLLEIITGFKHITCDDEVNEPFTLISNN